jgi:branched-chain amino acid transport system substrate-binding protein
MRDGAKLAIAEIHAAGGISVGARKEKIEIIERDDEGKNERGALIGQELASMGGLSGVIGTVNTGVVLAGDKHLQEKCITKIITAGGGFCVYDAMEQGRCKGCVDLLLCRA